MISRTLFLVSVVAGGSGGFWLNWGIGGCEVRGEALGSGQKVFYKEKFDLLVVYFLFRSSS